MNKSSNNTFTKLNKLSLPALIKKVESGELEIIGEPYIEKVEMFELISKDFKKKYNTFKGALISANKCNFNHYEINSVFEPQYVYNLKIK